MAVVSVSPYNKKWNPGVKGRIDIYIIILRARMSLFKGHGQIVHDCREPTSTNAVGRIAAINFIIIDSI